MFRDSTKPPVQCGVESGDDVALPPFPDIAEDNPGPLCRVLYPLLMRGGTATPVTYNSSESECKDLGQFDCTNEAGHLCRSIWLELAFVQIFIIPYEGKVCVETTES